MAAVVVGAVVGLAAPAGGDEADQRALAERYAPVMMLVEQPEACGPGEPYQPSDVDLLMENSSVALRGPWSPRDLVEVGPGADTLADGLRGYSLDLPGDPLSAGCAYEKWARATWAASAGTVYAHIARQDGYHGRIALQYFFYYPFNDFNNKHESDWEKIQLEFAAPNVRSALDVEPDLVAYAQHYGAETSRWDDEKLQVADATHPVVYVSAGSHASQYSEDLFLGRSARQGFGCDSTIGPHQEVKPRVETIPANTARATRKFPWIGYEGHWGEVGPRRFYQGPTGPNMKQMWDKPFSWSAKGRDRSFAVPGGGAYEGSATGFFCTAVTSGSDAFRNFTARPVPTLAVLGFGLLAVTWLVRRTSWGSSLPLPVLRSRTIGQVIAVSWLMFRSRPGLFVCIGLPAVGVSVASTLAQMPLDSSGVTGTLRSSAELLEGILLALALLLAQAAAVQALADLDAGRRVRVRDVYRAAVRRLLPVSVTVILAVICLLALTLTVVLLPVALALLVGWSLFIPVVLLERRSGFRALRRSWRLVRLQFFKVAALLVFASMLVNLTGGILATVVILAVQAPFAVVNLLPGVVATLLLPYVSLVIAYLYFSGRAQEQAKLRSPASQYGDPAGTAPAPARADSPSA
ncbi:MAG TPA: hypothetical protein VHG70_05360 [Nocardioidaceae bacterium]|nr:hypothetical protein [Nocardioidaceae bacterium]